MKQLLLLIFLTSFFLMACNTEQAEEEVTPPLKDVFVGIETSSNFTLDNILVKISEDHDYGSLNAGERSVYQQYSKAYEYAYVALEIEGALFGIQPIDYVGEMELPDGYYTYILTVDEQSNRLLLTFRED